MKPEYMCKTENAVNSSLSLFTLIKSILVADLRYNFLNVYRYFNISYAIIFPGI